MVLLPPTNHSIVAGPIVLDTIPPLRVIFDSHKIYHNLELWRLLTSFCYCGGPLNDLHSLLVIYLIYVHANQYELNPHPSGSGNRTADCAFCYIFCTLGILISYLVMDHYGVRVPPYFTRTLVFCILYLWSKRNPHAQIQLNFIPIQGQYLPFAHIGLSLLINHQVPIEILHGFAIGHVYYYLIAVLPIILGRPVITTPAFISILFGGGDGGDDDVHTHRLAGPGGNNNNERRQQQQQQQLFRDDGATMAHVAAKMGRLDDLQDLVQTSPEDFHAKDNNSWQPLHEAVRGGFIHIVNFLVENDVDINARTQHGRGPSPLWMAESLHGLDHPVMQRLTELGAIRLAPLEIGEEANEDDR